MNNPKISVIVPIYKVQKYLDKCIESIVNQTYKNLEIILVDDGSPDNCPQICDEWAKKDSRIVVIHKQNGGAADSRNAGLDCAQGDYVAFIDGDDYLNSDYFDVLYNALVQGDCSVATSHFNIVDEDGNTIEQHNYQFENSVASGKVVLDLLYTTNNSAYVAVCNKLFEKSVFDDLRFTTGSLCSDWGIVYKIYDSADNVACVNYWGYNYVIRQNSALRTKSNKRSYYCVLADYQQIEYFADKNNARYNSQLLFYLFSDFLKCSKLYQPNAQSKKVLKDSFKLLNKGFYLVLGKKYRFNKKYIIALIFYLFPRTISKIYDLRG